jgi:hypothetical protein
MKTKYVAAVVVIILAAGIGSFAYYNETQNTGTMTLSVADAGISGATAVYITFSNFSIHKAPGNGSSSNASNSSNGGWTNYSVGTKTINILNLNISNASLLGKISLTAGTYTMFRFYITNVTVDFTSLGNVSFILTSHFAFVSKAIKISAHSTTNEVFDFNLAQDLNLTSNVFTPNIGSVTVS